MGVIKSVLFTSVVLLLVSLVLSVEPPCPKPAGRCPRTWSYADAQNWGCKCAEWAQCSGTSQSPVDLPTPVLRNGWTDMRANMRYNNLTDLWLFNTGNYYGAPVSPFSGFTFEFNGLQYFLHRLEFHSPSEHMLNGVQYDLELELYHTRTQDPSTLTESNLVISIFFNRGVQATTNCFLEQLIYDLPQFSDCRCGNGRFEFINSTTLPTVGVNEQCDEGTRNSNDSTTPGCCRNDCKLPVCGDGVKDANEGCDNGPRNSNTTADACRLNCCVPTCGDGVLDTNEQCDDGNINNLDGCSSICRRECGDNETNFRNGIEQCDNGALNNDTVPNACRTTCRLPTCGDAVVDNGEQCDVRTRGINPSQCRSNCSAPRCGDGYTDLNEGCDDGPQNGLNNRCSGNCTLLCGNGNVDPGEECDNGVNNNNAPNSACRTNCRLPRCGDGIVDDNRNEQCDSNYIVNGVVIGNRYCNSTCFQVCGNGVKDGDEECDQGCYNADVPNRCRINCLLPRCGDGILDVTEECDPGDNFLSNSAPNSCRTNCTLPKCGDGVRDAGEECDLGAGRNLPGSGCDPTCRLECGNGCLDAGEECDDGPLNGNTSDSCRRNCRLPRCGDGIVDSREECDNGAANNDLLGNACRTDCRTAYCGDGVIDSANGEKCDRGAANDDLLVDGCSLFCIPNYCRQRQVRRSVDFTLLYPKNHTAYTYSGSWAKPPCTGPLQWFVFDEVQQLTQFQFEQFTAAPYGLYNTNRPVQALGSRAVIRPANPPAPVCGNGIQEFGEACDLGFILNSDWEANKCRPNCRLPACGDGVTDRGEECDDAGDNARCGVDCKLKPVLRNPFACPAWTYSTACAWSLRCPTWNLCAGDRLNAQQSPINFNLTALMMTGTPSFNLNYAYGNTTFSVVNTGRTIALLPNGLQTLTDAAGKVYSLNRVEIHTPSEHTFNGQHADAEAIFFHTALDGSRAAVSVLYNQGPTVSSFFNQFLFYLPPEPQCRLNNNVIDKNEACDNGIMNSDTRPGACRRNGKLPSCGDGVVDRGEQCDNGAANSDTPNRCRRTCMLPYCGDGIIDAGEQCDFNSNGGRPCTRQCTLLCGNGFLDAGEACDDGPRNSDSLANACRTTCVFSSCGDGIIDAGEQCDNGASVIVPGVVPGTNATHRGNSDTLSDSCRTNCRLPGCGDGVTDLAFNEECDDGIANGPNSRCLANCQLSCGTGLPSSFKECDDGAANSNTDGACRTNCRLPRCGDGILDRSRGEECDDGGNGTIYCSSSCKFLCGNGVREETEQCDDGTLNSDILPGACRTDCRRSYCGDGVLDAANSEQCDFGAQNSNSPNAPCRANCLLPRCGDGILDATEQCDNGLLNNVNGPCSPTCNTTCGNGRREPGEDCDNGADNDNVADACRRNCRLPFCGDGILDAGEQCDAGALNSDNGNSACRRNCQLPFCGDGVLDTLYGEVCDAGPQNNDFATTGCSSTCTENDCRSSTAPNSVVAALSLPTSPVISYRGSLLTPPCTENVAWFVFAQPQSLSPRQYNILKRAQPDMNSRGPQPLNGRVPVFTSVASVCGNCRVEPGEQCDQGEFNALVADKCRPNCRLPTCGDGIVDTDEECDEGTLNSDTGLCGRNCKHVTTCPANTATGFCSSCSTCGTTSSTTTTPASSSCACSSPTTINNQGTLINVNFANLLRGAGCNN